MSTIQPKYPPVCVSFRRRVDSQVLTSFPSSQSTRFAEIHLWIKSFASFSSILLPISLILIQPRAGYLLSQAAFQPV